MNIIMSYLQHPELSTIFDKILNTGMNTKKKFFSFVTVVHCSGFQRHLRQFC